MFTCFLFSFLHIYHIVYVRTVYSILFRIRSTFIIMTLRGFSATSQSMRRSGRGWISTPSLSYKFQTYKKSHSKILENEPRYPSDKKTSF